MTDNELGARLETLEVRYAHQESALEELTRTLLNQEQQVSALKDWVKRLETQVRVLAPSGADSHGEEPPPHY
ncbi:MAG: SlyX family protein [Gammaproteobacteria bacterium]|nr:MAG: SlyX family protein [Gammaproteobacteria bacterium]